MRRLSAYRVFLTRQTEYHIRGYVCFGVRDRRSGQWLESHWALRKRLAQTFADAHGKICSLRSPAIGEPLCFDIGHGLHQTSPVLAVEERQHWSIGDNSGPDRIHPLLRESLASSTAESLRDTH
jgi:hypothetical protein